MSKVLYAIVTTVVGFCIAGGAIAEHIPGHRPTDLFWQMQQSTWAILENAPGIVSGGNPNAVANIQIVFDPNCPRCAKIYQYLKQKHPSTSVRWTPVAYMRPDSYALAAAILASSDPPASLDRDEEHYDFPARKGGYPAPPTSTAANLGRGQQRLQQMWETKWGAFTPMIFSRDPQGRIFQAQTDLPEVIDQLVQRTMQPLKTYD